MKTIIHRLRNSLGSLLAAVALVAISSAPPARAAGLLIADGGLGGVLEIKEHDVQVTINNGIAVTKVTQVFHNTEKRQVEALYTFPVPKGASVANFSMWINGKEMVGEVLEKQRAREIYNSYKQVRRDPGLLEQVDYRTFEMRIFPIGPEADQKVQITGPRLHVVCTGWKPVSPAAGSSTFVTVLMRYTDTHRTGMLVAFAASIAAFSTAAGMYVLRDWITCPAAIGGRHVSIP